MFAAGQEIFVTGIGIRELGRDQWEALARDFADYNYRHLWEYGRMLAGRRKAQCRHVGVVVGGEVIGLADVRVKRASVLGGLAYVSGGPLVRKGDGRDLARLGDCLKALRQQFAESEGLVLRVQGSWGDAAYNEQAKACFAGAGFSASRAGKEYRTLVVDLAPPLPEIRSGLAQKWRNCLNKAERSNPPVKITTAAGDLARFGDLFSRFVSRKGFAVDLDADFFRELQKVLPQADALTLSYVETDGVMGAGHLSSTLGDTCVYLLGATSEQALKSNAAYLLQWHVLGAAKEKGARWYDLGGIDPEGNPGVYHFKSGTGGVEVVAPGPYEFVPNSIGAKMMLQAERAYGRFRRRKNPAAKS